jgi:predicted transcriptional regulator YdeE
MPKIIVSRPQVIDAPLGDVFEIVRDFHQWPKWSPWLIADPECQLEIQDEWDTWKGDVSGAGRIEVSGEVENESISYDLTFLKPFKSQANVKMIFSRKKEKTEVTWIIDGSLPFFMFWMKKSMEVFIGVKVDKSPGVLPDGMELITAPEMDVYAVKHFGPYRHLGNVWAGGMRHGRAKQFKASKKFPTFEIYEKESMGEEAVVKICLPMK